MATNVPTHSEQTLNGLRVLVVDDDVAILRVLATILQGFGADVVIASSAPEAFDAFTRHKPDILLIDIRMPKEDGYGLLARVRALEPTRGGQVPAIALTGFSDADDHAFSIAAGFDAHLMKPVAPDDLVTIVANLTR